MMKKNHISYKSRILLLFAGVFVGAALSFNYFWASSSAAFTSIHYNWVRQKNDLISSFKDAKDKFLRGYYQEPLPIYLHAKPNGKRWHLRLCHVLTVLRYKSMNSFMCFRDIETLTI
ncbi:hypothetical protein HanRHA438_Chr09g0385761 [Helianthus annuus]|uniref:Uncharacterized protein n=1 Tax=Helianthus annuus TaxID=4232 RepID=A0A251S8U4_HELAN|nr:hypothetical protein HanXRQr2_Chr09g0373721 [Helianthus annuus]KAJ0541367.1 hypothetical protein HanHA89_Chr09g0327631 [Helianthus annuus]KAJ0706446.1 hypothetical protein HanLR1_Chr09g0307101 [Helianthus annuus]KAJ0710482.1 hypothetical protein HanOQP8_Chr09g0312921 [Helianthus annuus]KAJ0886997.1 hypothetical protein HanRHA438_Chr09g0385761 [Helianthus annuus]